MRRFCRILGAAVAAAGLVAPVGPAAAAAPTALRVAGTACPDVQVVAARGTTEPGTIGGALSPLTGELRSALPGRVAVTGLKYPASSDWVNSANAGIASLAKLLTRQAKACPQQRFVLLGWSQGAWVIGDALAGGGGGAAAPIPPAVGTKVAAVVFYGDPRFRDGEPFDAGSHRDGVNGLIPREQGALADYASRIRSFCDSDDTVCQSGGKGQGHWGYWPKDDRAAVAFVRAQLRKPVAAPAAGTSGTPSAAPSPGAGPAMIASPTPSPPTPVAAPAPEPQRRNWFQRAVSWLNPFD